MIVEIIIASCAGLATIFGTVFSVYATQKSRLRSLIVDGCSNVLGTHSPDAGDEDYMIILIQDYIHMRMSYCMCESNSNIRERIRQELRNQIRSRQKYAEKK